MSELLLELLSEEIPARMQTKAATDFLAAAKEKLQANLLNYDSINTYTTPRRLVLHVNGLPNTLPETTVEKKGPRLGAPDTAINGFVKSVGKTLDQLEIREVAGEKSYFAVSVQPAQPVENILSSILNEIIINFVWPKSMRWGTYKTRWVRPLQNVMCLFDGKVLPVNIHHLAANNKSVGHKFMANLEFAPSSFNDYQTQLRKHYVILDAAERKEIIRKSISQITAQHNLILKQDEDLLEEVTGLIEWPQVLIGKFDQDFMELPKEVLITVMRTHQKYFAVENPDGTLAPYFITVSNVRAADQGKQIVIGNERVLAARFHDARFFFNQDRKRSLHSYSQELAKVVFHNKLGSMLNKANRLAGLAKLFPGNHNDMEKAALLCKADLVTSLVGEFPELQGIMGSYYALLDNESEEIANAIREHYAPIGARDLCPTSPLSSALAIADRIDTIAGLFLAGEKPTGSKDPFAIRRSALGVIRIILENNIQCDLKTIFNQAVLLYREQIHVSQTSEIINTLLEFFADRVKFLLKADNIRHDVISAVFNLDQEYNLCKIVARAKALQEFLELPEGKIIITAYKRAAQIVTLEENKDNTHYNGKPELYLLSTAEEKLLFQQLQTVKPLISETLQQENYLEAMKLISNLKIAINNFFDNVTVNSDDDKLRKNRLLILSNIRDLLGTVANFSLLEG